MRPFISRPTGLSLGSVLLVLTVLSTLLFGLAAAGLTHYGIFTAHFNRSAAMRAARSVVARGLVELRRNPQWGADKKATLSVDYSSSRGPVVGLLTFAPGTQPYSSNNLEAAQSEGWGGKMVPAEFIRLVGVGRCRGQEQVVEAWYHAPTYPWAIAAGGPVKLSGGAKVAGLSRTPTPGHQVQASDLGPADLRSNGDSVLLGKGTEVYGDVLTSGRLEVESGANLTVGPLAPTTPLQDSVWVHGAVKSAEGEPPISSVDFGRFDPRALKLAHSSLAQDHYDAYKVADTRRRDGSVTFSNGLKLEGGLLFVEGDLTVRGGMTGSGLVVCTGKVTVEGASSLTAGSGVALVAGGQVTLTGAGASGSYFQGLVYTDTGFSAERVSLVGPLVSRGTGAVELAEAQLLMPDGVKTQWAGASAMAPNTTNALETVTKLHLQDGTLVDDKSWESGWVYQRHETVPGNPAAGYTYEGTRFRKVGGVVDPTPVERKETTNLTSWLMAGTIDKETYNELPSKLVSPGDIDPEPPPADPQADRAQGVHLDANQFFRLRDRIRIVLWIEGQ